MRCYSGGDLCQFYILQKHRFAVSGAAANIKCHALAFEISRNIHCCFELERFAVSAPGIKISLAPETGEAEADIGLGSAEVTFRLQPRALTGQERDTAAQSHGIVPGGGVFDCRALFRKREQILAFVKTADGPGEIFFKNHSGSKFFRLTLHEFECKMTGVPSPGPLQT